MVDILPHEQKNLPTFEFSKSNINSVGDDSVVGRGSLKSPNYRTGQSGWNVDFRGNAEFQEISTGNSNVDRKFEAGEDLNSRDAVGLVGEIAEVTADVACTQATYTEFDNPDTNFDDDANEILVTDGATGGTTGVGARHGLLSFSSPPTTPTGTGLTMLKWEIRIQGTQFNGNTNQNVHMHALTSTFDETTVTWNNEPSLGNDIGQVGYATGAFDTGFIEVTEAEYNQIRLNGIGLQYDAANGAQTKWGDEDNATPPKLDVRFTYKIQDGDIYKVKATTAEYANSFVGFVKNDTKETDVANVRIEGVLDGFSLTSGVTYYLSDTDGAIDTSAGSNSKIVGRSLSTEDLQVKSSIT